MLNQRSIKFVNNICSTITMENLNVCHYLPENCAWQENSHETTYFHASVFFTNRKAKFIQSFMSGFSKNYNAKRSKTVFHEQVYNDLKSWLHIEAFSIPVLCKIRIFVKRFKNVSVKIVSTVEYVVKAKRLWYWIWELRILRGILLRLQLKFLTLLRR